MSSSSFKLYGKVDEADHARLLARRKTRRRLLIIVFSSIVLVGVIVAAVVGTSTARSKSGGDAGNSQSSFSSSVKAVCDATRFPDSCCSSLSTAAANDSSLVDPVKLFQLSLTVAVNAISEASYMLTELEDDGHLVDKMSRAAMSGCHELLDLAVDHINESLHSYPDLNSDDIEDDLKTWLSAAGTYLQTCMDGFDHAPEEFKAMLAQTLKNSTEFTSNSLAIVSAIFKIAHSFKMRKLLSYSGGDYELPHWLSSKDRKLLQAKNYTSTIKADIVVAKDGSGKYKTINDALAAVPDKSKKRTVIYVKKGIYNENVRVEKSKWNVMIIGDGKDATIVSGNRNFVDGTPTFQTATFAAFGKGFIARDMGFRNTAGAIKHQAVAMMASADETVFYRCKFDAYQDTLYAISLRQFYRDCDIYGTVDFIFGNAAAVFQSCNIRPKVPMQGQQDTLTAQGKLDPNQNTGIVIHNCTITPLGNLTSVRTYLGRPWKPYSTTIYMKSMLGSVIDPTGWLPWIGNTAPDTIYYAEFGNYGAGSSTKKRVKWKGLKYPTAKDVQKFTVKPFISGDKWISDQTEVPYSSNL